MPVYKKVAVHGVHTSFKVRLFISEIFVLSKHSLPPIVPPIKQYQTKFLGLFLYLLNTSVFMGSILREEPSLKLVVLF